MPQKLNQCHQTGTSVETRRIAELGKSGGAFAHTCAAGLTRTLSATRQQHPALHCVRFCAALVESSGQWRVVVTASDYYSRYRPKCIRTKEGEKRAPTTTKTSFEQSRVVFVGMHGFISCIHLGSHWRGCLQAESSCTS